MSKRKPEEDASPYAEVDRLEKENAALRIGIEHALRVAGETEPSGEDWASRIFNALKCLKRDLAAAQLDVEEVARERSKLLAYIDAAKTALGPWRITGQPLPEAVAEVVREFNSLSNLKCRQDEENECLRNEIRQTQGLIAAYVDSQGGRIEIPLSALTRPGPGWALTAEDDWRGMVRIIRVRKDEEQSK